ncbi:MAG: hypothetical protein OXI41_06895 [Chloroflexota bacterium]|nr:hypothetical protein [Chloroflexota bacterium]
MTARWRKPWVWDVAIFVAVAAVVAVVVVMIGRELGVEGSATADTPPLTLSLSAGSYCETSPAMGFYGANLETGETTPAGWGRVSEIPVQWTATGGNPPYRLTIDGEQRDASGKYEGASGTASVSCALSFSDPYIYERPSGNHSRRFKNEPQVDSGQKTIRAVVTDGDETVAYASVDIYVILNGPSVLNRGRTYRVWGRLFTVPDAYDLRPTGGDDIECPEDQPESRCETEYGFAVLGIAGEARIYYFESDFTESQRWQILADGTLVKGRITAPTDADKSSVGAGQSAAYSIDAALDDLTASMGKLPSTATAQR